MSISVNAVENKYSCKLLSYSVAERHNKEIFIMKRENALYSVICIFFFTQRDGRSEAFKINSFNTS